MTSRRTIVVVGAGVIGLTTAVRLQEASYRVAVLTAAIPSDTTSANSGAVWGPFLSEIDSRVLQWSFDTLDEFQALARIPATGVELVRGLGAADFQTDVPDWVMQLGDSSECEPSDLPVGYLCGWIYRVPIIDMPVYLEYLLTRFEAAGGLVIQEFVTDIGDLSERAEHVVLCAGLGARELAKDASLVPSKGQLVVVENPGIDEFFAERGDGPELTYILPQGGQVILGGTALWEYDDDEFDAVIADRIVERCAKIDPRLRDASILGHRVGIRPYRPIVRLEHEVRAHGDHIVHNYGHGGSGVSLSWGCAIEVLDILESCGGS